ncbi:MAG: hypothetical protein J5772_07535 [Clostridia bacterium]|nr:hypothetical protein [Clostridia bacterium]
MKNLNEYKAEIRRRIAYKTNKRIDFRKKASTVLAIISAVLICGAIIIFSKKPAEEKVVFISADHIKTYTAFDDLVKDSDLIMIGTVQNEQAILSDPSSPEEVMTEYLFSIERLIAGDCKDGFLKVTAKGGVVDGISYTFKGAEQFKVGDTYLVFLKEKGTGVLNAYKENTDYMEVSPIQGKMQISGETIDMADIPCSEASNPSSVTKIDDLIELIQSLWNDPSRNQE